MPVFPPPTVEVRLDGRPILAYHHALLIGNRVMAPVGGFATRIATIVRQTPTELQLRRGDATIVLVMPREDGLPRFALAQALRRFGFEVRYDAKHHVLVVHSPLHRPIVRATPYHGQTQPVREIFTPMPMQTPRPPFHGPMRPRRTPIPIEFWATPSPSQHSGKS